MKRLLALMMTLVLIVMVSAVSVSAENGYYLGDADRNGEVEIIDATLIMRCCALISVPGLDEVAADVDGDGLDSIDATLIQRFLALITVQYPIGEFISVQQPATQSPTSDPYELPVVYR